MGDEDYKWDLQVEMEDEGLKHEWWMDVGNKNIKHRLR